MFDLARNTFAVYYKNYLGNVEIIDEYGNKTGSFIPQYSDIQKIYISISPNKGTSESEMFGSIDEYDRTMTTADTSCPIDEETILWIDGKDIDSPHNYYVKKRAPWKNGISYAIKKVDVSQ